MYQIKSPAFCHLHRKVIDIHLQSRITRRKLIYVALYSLYAGEEGWIFIST